MHLKKYDKFKKCQQLYGAKVGTCYKLNDVYEVEMSLGLFKTSDKKNSNLVKPNLCRINLRKSDDNKSFNLEGLVCIRKNEKHNQKLYPEVEHVHLELEKTIKNDTNLTTKIDIKAAEIEIHCNSSKYLTISGATLALYITRLIGKKII